MSAIRISPSFTENEANIIRKASAHLGYNPSQFIRHAALSVAHKHCGNDILNKSQIKNPKSNLTKRLRVRLSSQEMNILQKKAREYGYSLSGIFRKAAFAFFKKERLYPKEVLLQANILSALLRNIGTNINQIARHTNRRRGLSIVNLIKVRELVKNLEEEVFYFLTHPFHYDHQVDEPKDKKL